MAGYSLNQCTSLFPSLVSFIDNTSMYTIIYWRVPADGELGAGKSSLINLLITVS